MPVVEGLEPVVFAAQCGQVRLHGLTTCGRVIVIERHDMIQVAGLDLHRATRVAATTVTHPDAGGQRGTGPVPQRLVGIVCRPGSRVEVLDARGIRGSEHLQHRQQCGFATAGELHMSPVEPATPPGRGDDRHLRTQYHRARRTRRPRRRSRSASTSVSAGAGASASAGTGAGVGAGGV